MESGMKNQGKEKQRVAELDLISRLPDPIIHHIYSFLPSRDVTCTSILSKTWNRTWSSYLYVVFNFIWSSYDVEENQQLNLGLQKEIFLSLTERSVSRRLEQEFYMQRFQMYIDFPDLELLTPYMNRWISVAVERSVPELALRVDCFLDQVRSHYRVPQIVLHSKSLKALSLSGCTFDSSLSVKLPHLEKLSLSHCHFADKFSIHSIVSGCPVIQYVKVSFCKWMDTVLFVSSLSRLKHLEFLRCDDVKNVEIHVPNLHRFSFASVASNWPRSIDLTTCTALKELKLNGAGVFSEFVPQPIISQLPALEVLEIQNCTGSEGFRLSSQRLKKLVFRNCHNLKNANIDTPNLQSFEYCNCEEPFIPVNASNSLKVHLIFSFRGKTVDWLIRLKHFLLNLTCSEDLKLILYHQSKDMIIHEQLSKVSFSSLCNFLHPKFICISSKSYTNLVDELFPAAYPETLFVIHSHDKLVELLLKKMKDLRSIPNLERKLVDFNVDISGEGERTVHPVTKVFMKAHSSAPFQTSTIILNWTDDVSGRRVTL